MSQMFAYNRTPGVLRPMWYSGQGDGTTDTMTAQDVAAAGGVERELAGLDKVPEGNGAARKLALRSARVCCM